MAFITEKYSSWSKSMDKYFKKTMEVGDLLAKIDYCDKVYWTVTIEDTEIGRGIVTDPDIPAPFIFEGCIEYLYFVDSAYVRDLLSRKVSGFTFTDSRDDKNIHIYVYGKGIVNNGN